MDIKEWEDNLGVRGKAAILYGLGFITLKGVTTRKGLAWATCHMQETPYHYALEYRYKLDISFRLKRWCYNSFLREVVNSWCYIW